MTNGPHSSDGRRIRSVMISFNIIESLQTNGQLGVTELSTELEHSKSTIYAHLRTLEDVNIVVQCEEKYRLSLKFLNIAETVRDQVVNYDVVKKEVDALSEETGEIAQFGLEEYGQVSYLYKSSGDQAVRTASKVGTSQPIYSTALGKAILAYLPEERQRKIVDVLKLLPKTKHTITEMEELYDEIDRVAERGYAIDNEENIEGLVCVAAPVRDGKQVYGAISVSTPSSRVSEKAIAEELSDQVKRAANVIELNTRFH